MTTCAWHKKYFPNEPEKIIDKSNPKLKSHGMCLKCSKKFDKNDKEIDKTKSKEDS